MCFNAFLTQEGDKQLIRNVLEDFGYISFCRVFPVGYHSQGYSEEGEVKDIYDFEMPGCVHRVHIVERHKNKNWYDLSPVLELLPKRMLPSNLRNKIEMGRENKEKPVFLTGSRTYGAGEYQEDFRVPIYIRASEIDSELLKEGRIKSFHNSFYKHYNPEYLRRSEFASQELLKWLDYAEKENFKYRGYHEKDGIKFLILGEELVRGLTVTTGVDIHTNRYVYISEGTYGYHFTEDNFQGERDSVKAVVDIGYTEFGKDPDVLSLIKKAIPLIKKKRALRYTKEEARAWILLNKDRVITVSDSVNSGNCGTGTMQFIQSHGLEGKIKAEQLLPYLHNYSVVRVIGYVADE